MRFDEIQIPAFGPFTGFSLAIPKKKADLHLIHGPNEAGKSSLLRALRHLLYGIPVQTTDNFRHGYQEFRIGATISRKEESLTFFRKKGNRNTLLDQDGESLSDQVLAHFLGPVDEAFFENMFGLDTLGLRKGANQLLSGEGEFGAAIFSASRGGTPINEAIRKLEAEAHALYKDRSRNTTIAILMRDLKDFEKAGQEATISTHRWQSMQTSLRAAEKEFQEKDEARSRHLIRRDFVGRCLQALPVAQKMRRLENELGDISLPELPIDFVNRVRTAENALSSAKLGLALYQQRRVALESDLAAIEDPSPVLERAGDLDLLHRRFERYEEAQETVPSLQAQLTTLNGLLSLDDDLSGYPTIDSRTVERFKETASALQETQNRMGHLQDDLANLEDRMEKGRKVLASLGASDELEALRDLVSRSGDFAARRNRLLDDLEELRLLDNKIVGLRSRLEVDGAPQTLLVPSRAVMEEEDRKRRAIHETIRDLEKELIVCRDDLLVEQAALDHLSGEKPLATPADLQEARETRDALWKEILRSGDPDEKLTSAIRVTDDLADSLRVDAGLIATASGHQARLKALELRKKDLEEDLDQARQAHSSWIASWDGKFARKVGQLPLDFIAWREDWEILCGLVEQSEVLRGRVDRLRAEEAELLAKLTDDDFEAGYRRLRRKLENALEEQGNREAIQTQLTSDQLKKEQLQSEMIATNKGVERLSEEWRELCGAIDLSTELSCQSALREIESRLLTRSQLRERIELEAELKKHENFLSDYRNTLSKCAGVLKVEPSEPVLFEMFEQAKERRNRQQALRSQMSRLEEEVPILNASLEKAGEDWKALQRQAGSEELEEVLVTFELRRGHREKLAIQTDLLEGLAGGMELSRFLGELDSLDPAALQEEAAGLEDAGTALQEERDRAKEALDDLRRVERELRDTGDLAATHRQEAADTRSALAGHFHRFRLLHHAIDFLREQVEAYREKVQGPMIQRTTNFFQTLTAGAFERVVARPDDHDVPRLLAIRSSGEEVPTSGLSEGTRDQLFLALRFAAIDLHLEHHAPLPLILDDLLMTFDDERVKALVPVLSEVSQKTQVLLFTHHEHLINLIGGEASVHALR